MSDMICGHDREALRWALDLWATMDAGRVVLYSAGTGSGKVAKANAARDLDDPAKLAKLLASEGRRLGWAVYHEDPGDSLLLPCLLVVYDEDDSVITIERFDSWQDCKAEPHGIELAMPQARAILAAWLELGDGETEKAKEALRGDV